MKRKKRKGRKGKGIVGLSTSDGVLGLLYIYVVESEKNAVYISSFFFFFFIVSWLGLWSLPGGRLFSSFFLREEDCVDGS